MSSRHIPEDVARYIMERIDSVAQMEALLLFRSDDKKSWSVEELAQRLYIGRNQTAQVVRRLEEEGIVRASSDDPSVFEYGPNTPELEAMLDRVAEAYTRHLVPVTNIIHSKPKTRVQEFAEAFRIRKDK